MRPSRSSKAAAKSTDTYFEREKTSLRYHPCRFKRRNYTQKEREREGGGGLVIKYVIFAEYIIF